MNLILQPSQEKALNDYLSPQANHCTPIINFFLSDKRYSSKYFKDLYREILKGAGIKLKKRDSSISSETSLFIYINTSLLNINVMQKVFGEGINHSKFGEGADGEKELIKALDGEDCKSYFLTDKNNNFYHITIDHRGTSIELPINTTPKIFAEFQKDIFKLVHKYNKKGLDYIVKLKNSK